jgi:hypothetical protein
MKCAAGMEFSGLANGKCAIAIELQSLRLVYLSVHRRIFAGYRIFVVMVWGNGFNAGYIACVVFLVSCWS